MLLLAGCSGPVPDEPVDEAEEPEYEHPRRGSAPTETPDCDDLPVPEVWVGHSSGTLWCVPDTGYDSASGSTGVYVLPFTRTYGAVNGSQGFPVGSPVEAHLYLTSWTGPAHAEVTIVIRADGEEVARLEGETTFASVILVSDILGNDGTWVDLEGTLSALVPPGALLEMEYVVEAVAPTLLMGQGGAHAPWFAIG